MRPNKRPAFLLAGGFTRRLFGGPLDSPSNVVDSSLGAPSESAGFVRHLSGGGGRVEGVSRKVIMSSGISPSRPSDAAVRQHLPGGTT